MRARACMCVCVCVCARGRDVRLHPAPAHPSDCEYPGLSNQDSLLVGGGLLWVTEVDCRSVAGGMRKQWEEDRKRSQDLPSG